MRHVRQPLGRFNGLCAQTPGRIVDDPPQAKVIRPVVDHAQVRQHILDFRPVKETGAADDTIRNSVSLQREFQGV